MAWRKVAEGKDFDSLQQLVGDMELTKGTRVKVEMEVPWYAVPAFDLAGAEWPARLLVPEGMELVDVYGAGGKGIILMEADPAWLVPVLGFIVTYKYALLITIGLFTVAVAAIVMAVRVSIEVPAVVQPFFWLTVAGVAAVGVIGVSALRRTAERRFR